MKLIGALLITLLDIISVASLPHSQNSVSLNQTVDLKPRFCREVPHSIPDEHIWCHISPTNWCTLTAFISHPSFSAIGWVFSSACTELGSNYALNCDPSIHSPSLPWVTVVNTYDSKLDLVEVWYYGSPTIRSWQGGCDCYNAWSGFEGLQDRICECRFYCGAPGPNVKRDRNVDDVMKDEVGSAGGVWKEDWELV